MKKSGIIAAAAVIAALAAGIVILNRTDTDAVPSETDAPSAVTTILDTSDATSAEVKNEYGTLYLENGGAWELRGITDTDSAKVEDLADNALVYTSETPLSGSPADYGLDNPKITVSITDGELTHTVLVGDKSAVDNVYFASADGVLFTMRAAQFETLNEPSDYYTEFTRIALNIDEISDITIKRGSETIRLTIPEITRMEGNVWHMTSPYDTLASDTYIDEYILPSLESLSLSQKGDKLGTPAAVVTVTEDDSEYVFRLGDTTDGKIAVEYSGGVYLEDAQLFDFVNADLYELVNKLVSYVNIADCSGVVYEHDGATDTLEISSSGDDYAFKLNGGDIDVSDGKKIYTAIIGVESMSLYNGEPLGDTLARVTFEGDAATTVEYKYINEYSVAAVKNGSAIFTVNTDELNKLSEVFK